jgi:sulfite exporter TauE/SafE
MLVTAFILGLAGSLHCAGMCSPLAFAVTGMRSSAIVNKIWYNAGRILIYGTLGSIVSSLGVVLPLERFQNSLSVGMGILLVLVGILGTTWLRIPYVRNPFWGLTNFLKNRFARLIQRKNVVSMFFMGTLNGFLPCGLTLIALTSCLILPSSLEGFYFMIVFGLGTLPVMVGFASLVKFLTGRYQLSFHRVNTIMLILAGSLLIARAYVNHNHVDSFSNAAQEVKICQ